MAKHRDNGSPAQKVLASRIRKARHEMPQKGGRPTSQQAFATLVGVHWTTVAAWESTRQVPTALHLAKIAEVTGHPLEWFFGTEDDEEARRAMQVERGIQLVEDLYVGLHAVASGEVDLPERLRSRFA
jgi:transcriptional regulator with XRE-family HTH domain